MPTTAARTIGGCSHLSTRKLPKVGIGTNIRAGAPERG
jgi:hypothetical protein